MAAAGGLWICLALVLASLASSAPTPEDCTTEMFGNSSTALWACRTQLALQRNWFPSPIAGLFSYQVWNGFDGFWQNGAVLETFANFMYYGNHTRYQTCLKSSLRQMYDLELAYAPAPSYDDMAWFALSYLRIYEVLGDDDFLTLAKQIHDWNYQYGWDHTGACGGGYWFYDQKTTITNVQMLQLSAKLYRHTNDTSFLRNMTMTWKYIQKNRLIDPDTFQVSNIATKDCTGNRDFNKTFNSGVLVGGLVEMYHILNDTSYLTLAHRVAQATIFYSSRGGVLVERCWPEGCDEDEYVYKGLFVRYLRYLMDVSDDDTRRAYSDWLDGNIKSVIANAICWPEKSACNITYRDGPSLNNKTGPVFTLDWRGPFNISNPMVQAEVFDLLVANIEPGTTCRGAGCTYDPPVPPPRHLTCADKPCPAGEPCCEYQQYYTCCETTQKCIRGVCT
ncbi:Hypp4900 [Branchiostoma lanceolatum]|uniref:Hypp4900 protein n=1 Tax=Branchiostoma lanceolatum TaxID=7740 RepID=A0A8K0AH65_BRALA|nr:Hypp4900 [Branchiostoma lanceolatum]